MKLKKKLALLALSTCMIANSLYGLEVTPIEKTFSYDNIQNTVASRINSNESNLYMITKDNKLRAIGDSIYGSSVKDSQGIWVDILDGPFGVPIENVVYIEATSDKVYVITSLGECYKLDSTGTTKLNPPEKISSVKARQGYSNRTLFIGESGKAYIGESFSEIVSNGVKFKDVALFNNSNVDGYGILLSEDGKIYSISSSLVAKNIVTNIDREFKDISFHFNGNCYMMLDISGDVYYFSNSYINNAIVNLTKLELNYGNNPVRAIKFIDNNYVSNGTTINEYGITDIVHTEGVRYYNSFSTYTDYIPNLNIVHWMVNTSNAGSNNFYNNSNINLQICTDGKVKVVGTRTSEIFKVAADYTSYIDITQPWMNGTIAIPEKYISSFNVTTNQIISRGTSLDVDFSLISKTKPTAFNVYFSQAEAAGDRTKWVEIAKNVSADSLYQSDTATSYVNGDGNTINRRNYRYNWVLPNRNLVDITVILEPIY